MVTRFSSAGALLLALAACDGTSAAGRIGGEGGAGGVPLGADPAAGFGGAEGSPVDLSFVSWEVRSGLWAPSVPDVPALPGYLLFLDEEAGACEAYRDWRFGPRPHRFKVILAEPAVGDCPTDPEREQGCRSRVVFEPGHGRGIALWALSPTTASVRIDRFDGGFLRGELRATFPTEPEAPTGSGGSSNGERWLICTGLTGLTRECTVEAPGQNCCNEGKPLEEVVVPFDAAFCPGASACSDPADCEAVERAGACVAPVVDCAIACAALSDSCGSCVDCGGDPQCEAWSVRGCEQQIAACPAECAAAGGQPLASVGMACLAAGATCETWRSCLSTCGGDR